MIKEDLLNPSIEMIQLCFLGKNSSGIVEMSTKEFMDAYDHIKSRTHLIKGMKLLR